MRIWDLVPPSDLCRQHLLGEHRELHGLWNILRDDKKGYADHPETKRWTEHITALAERHTVIVSEMLRRGYNHLTPLTWPVSDEIRALVGCLQVGDPPPMANVHVVTGCCKPEPWDDQLTVFNAKAAAGCGCKLQGIDATVTETPGGNWVWDCQQCPAESPHMLATEVQARRGAYLHCRSRHPSRSKPQIQTLRPTPSEAAS